MEDEPLAKKDGQCTAAKSLEKRAQSHKPGIPVRS